MKNVQKKCPFLTISERSELIYQVDLFHYELVCEYQNLQQ